MSLTGLMARIKRHKSGPDGSMGPSISETNGRLSCCERCIDRGNSATLSFLVCRTQSVSQAVFSSQRLPWRDSTFRHSENANALAAAS